MKITINKEEVLCDKNFTIEEEMLNTSSVILNNVYPKAWEEDKDYVSRFYYPKDYSKCKIFDEIVHPATREDVEGTNFSINVDTTKQYEIQTLKGQITQNGTPTPDSPVPINITTGRQVVSVIGKNLFNDTLRQGVTTYNTGQWSNSAKRITSTDWITLKAGTYTISAKTSYTGSGHLQISNVTFDTNGNFYNLSGVSGQWKNLPFTFTTPIDLNWKCNICFSDSADITPSLVYDIQVEEGSSSSSYEEYKGNDYEINLGKNLFDNSQLRTGTFSGVSVSYENGNIVLNGTSTTTIDLYLYRSDTSVNVELLNYLNSHYGNYVLSNNLGYANYIQVQSGYKSNTANITSSDTTLRAFVRLPNNTTFNNTIINIQLEKGSTPTSYAKYFTPIYLGEIGNYKDYIFRNTTENPLYDSNLEEGQWYLHKEVGKVVLDSTNHYSGGTTGTNAYYLATNISDGATDNSKELSMSNMFKPCSFNARGNGLDITYVQNGRLTLRTANNTSIDWSTGTARQNWLNANKPICCYVLNTPTNTLIEDEELINQLNAIELLEGLNNIIITSNDLSAIMSLMYNYQEGYTEEDMLFCGVVENTGNISLNPRHPHYCNLQVLDFKTFLSEGETLDFVIYNKTILEAINQVINTISEYGFVLGNVNILHSDEVIGAYSTKDKTAYDVFNYIADITQSRWTTRMIDENTVAIDFYDPTLMPEGVAIEYTKEWFCNNNIMDMSFSYSSRDYRNKQVMLSGEVYANIETTEVIVADGYQTQFNTIDKIGYVSSILLNGSPTTIITKEEYDLGYDGDFIYQPGNKYFESTNLVSTGAIITIVYFAIIEGREIVLNQEEISRISNMTDRKGIIARYENRNDATTTSELQAIGQSYLKYKGSPEVSLKVDTLNNIWNIGERVSFSAPLTELTTEYMVKKKTINYITTQDNIFYTYELSSNFNSETEINYFDNQRSKMMGNIGQGEFISRNIDIENTANVVFYDLEVQEVEITSNNTLQTELQGALGGVE